MGERAQDDVKSWRDKYEGKQSRDVGKEKDKIISKLNQTVKRLEAEVSDLQSRLERSSELSTIKKKEQRITKLMTDLKRVKSEVVEARKALKLKTKAHDKQTKQIHKLEGLQKEKEDQIEMLKKQSTKMKKDITKLRRKTRDSKVDEEKQKLQEKVNELQTALQAAEGEISFTGSVLSQENPVNFQKLKQLTKDLYSSMKNVMADLVEAKVISKR